MLHISNESININVTVHMVVGNAVERVYYVLYTKKLMKINIIKEVFKK